MAPKFLFPKGFNFNLPLSIISLLNQPLKYINISTLSISFHPFSAYNFLNYGPQLNPLLIYISLLIFYSGSCLHHSTEMSLAKVTNNLQIDKSSIDFSGSVLFGLSGTDEYFLQPDFLQWHYICFLLPSWPHLGLLYKLFLHTLSLPWKC